MFMAGLGANFEHDLRGIIAVSTLRQLGLMIITVSVGLCGLAFFYLLTLALFKALFFNLPASRLLGYGVPVKSRCLQ
jgi:NADH-ubiquinone oxidoreductase chain 5